jgi:hypothetical protein
MSSSPLEQLFLIASQLPNLRSNSGGAGDAGTSEHQLGLTGAAGVGCWASALEAISGPAMATTINIAITFTSFKLLPLWKFSFI